MLILPYIPSIPSVPKIEMLYQNQERSETPEISSPGSFNYTDGPYELNGCRERFLAVISMAEGTYYKSSNTNGLFDHIQFDLAFGGKRFYSYADHPKQLNTVGSLTSDAAGAFQFLSSTWETIANELDLDDFSPTSQIQGAIHLINEAGVLEEIDECKFTREIIDALAPTWASFPTLEGKSYYGQSFKSYEKLHEFWKDLANVVQR